MNLFRRPTSLFCNLYQNRPLRLKPNVYTRCPLSAIKLHTDLYDPLISLILKRLSGYSCRVYCTKSDGASTKFTQKKDEIKAYLEHNKEKLRDREQRLKEKGYVILQDLKNTKSKVRERVEEIVIVSYYNYLNKCVGF